jgi:hypothetical protein
MASLLAVAGPSQEELVPELGNLRADMAVPSDLDAIFIGLEDTDYADATDGRLGFAYLRGSALSADWRAAEYSNLNAPASFYSIA